MVAAAAAGAGAATGGWPAPFAPPAAFPSPAVVAGAGTGSLRSESGSGISLVAADSAGAATPAGAEGGRILMSGAPAVAIPAATRPGATPGPAAARAPA